MVIPISAVSSFALSTICLITSSISKKDKDCLYDSVRKGDVDFMDELFRYE